MRIISIFVPKVLNVMCMNKKTLLFFLLFALMTPFAAIAQSITVSGKVVSSDDGYGLPGVTIQVKNSSNGTVTDMDGNYSLNADSKDILVYSFVGYKTKEIAIKARTKSMSLLRWIHKPLMMWWLPHSASSVRNVNWAMPPRKSVEN